MPSQAAREKWNAEHLTHINFAVPKTLATDFKAKCRRDGVSIAGTLTSLMRKHLCIKDEPSKPSTNTTSADTRARRREKVRTIITTLEDILDSEEAYLDRIPENLQGSIRAEDASHSISMLSDAIEILCDTY
jgi:hypothetical protein